MDAYKAEKERLYLELDRVQADSGDESGDVGRKESEKVLAVAKRLCQKLQEDSIATRGLPRSLSDSHVVHQDIIGDPNSDIHPRSAVAGPDSTTILRRSLTGGDVARPLQNLTNTLGTGAELPRKVQRVVGNKRKRDADPQILLPSLQIFDKMHFFFFPNNNLHPGRRMRVNKSVEFGAVWRKDWSDSVTHVVTDKNIDYKLLLRYLKLDTLPPHVTLVNENYPADCISYRCILDPDQQQYKVKDAPVVKIHDKAIDQNPIATSSDRSLELKATGKRGEVLSETVSQSTGTASSPVRLINSSQTDRATAKMPLSTKVSETPLLKSINFEHVIQQARELQQLPLDDDDEEEFVTPDERSKTVVDFRNTRKGQDAFQCMHKNTAEPNAKSPNHLTISILQKMADYYNMSGDEWRTRAYRKAISALRKHPQKIYTRDQARQIPQIGHRIATKIEEIAFTNRLRRLDAAVAEPKDQILQKFMGIYGVGFTQASKWVAAGYKTFEDLLTSADVTANQRIGITHYDDFNSRIPRAEVEEIGAIVRANLEELVSDVELIVGGSYRRGSESSGDVDCIITHPTLEPTELRSLVLDRLVHKLTADKFFVAQLSASFREDGSKWLGACQLPGSSVTDAKPWRRIDLLIVPRDELGAALIYFTGNDLFNRSMRLLASTKGMRLNQRGLYRDVMRGKARVKVTEGSLVEGRDERKIFAALGVPWRPPEHRVC